MRIVSGAAATLCALVLLGTVLVAGPAGAVAHEPSGGSALVKKVPSRQQWLHDIHRILKRHHARRYIVRRASSAHHHKLALNLDIDNTVHATYYGGGAIPEMLALTRLAHRHHVAVMFNTGRAGTIREQTRAMLHRDGFGYRRLCMRHHGERLVHSKVRCRRKFRRAGWTLIENIGNSPTDLVGGGYERGIRLPNYGSALG